MAVVTISRQFGAGGLRVAPAVAAALRFRLVNREIMEEAARRAGVHPDVAEHLDERVPDLVEEVGLALAAGSPELAGAPRVADDRTFQEAVREVIVSLAASGGYVILGRGGQAAIGDRPDACHLQLVGDLDDRARRVAEWRGIPIEEALDLCRRTDAERAAYVRRLYDVEISDPLLYDAVVNTARLGLDRAITVACQVARAKLGRDP